jgi:serine/threonine-protein kinase
VEAAHKKQIVHRDLKAPNIKLTPDGHIKVMDFGLAKQLALEVGADSKVSTFSGRLTEHGATPGTVFYMSPEQVRGEEVDPRSDIFSVGVVLYEMSTGKLPFQGATSGLAYDAILNRGPTPPRRLNPDLPVELEQIIHKALEKDRENRYQSAKELIVDLRRLKRDTDASAPGMPVFGERAKYKNKAVWTWAAVLGLLLVSLGLVIFWPSTVRDGEAIDSLAVLPFENPRNDPEVDYLSDGIAESLINRLSQLPQLRVMARSTTFRYRDPGIDLQAVGRELGVGAVLTGRVVQLVDGTLNVHAELVDVASGSQLWGQGYDREMEDIVSVQSDIVREISQALHLQLTGEVRQALAKRMTASSEAYQSYLKGRFFWYKRTNEDFKKAIEFFEEAKEKDPGYALAHAGLADGYFLLGTQFYGPDEDFPFKEAFAKARTVAQQALQLDPSLVEARTTLAFMRFWADWDWEGTEREFQQAFALNPNYATAHQWHAWYLSSMERHDEAIEESKRAIELDPTSPLQNRDLGIFSYRARRYEDAIEQLEKTLELDPSFPETQEYLVDAYWLSGMKEKAIAEANALDESLGRFYQLVEEGKQAEASRLRESLVEHSHLDIPRYYMLPGDVELLFQRFEAAFQERHPLLPAILADPHLDPVRSDPRFIDLRKRMGLE